MWADWINLGILVVLIGGIVFTWLQIRAMRRARDADLLAHLTMLWESEPLTKSREAIQASKQNLPQALEESLKRNVPQFIKLIAVANFFETIGLLVDLKSLGHKAAKELFESAVWEYYRLYDPYIKAHRGEDPSIYIYFEKLMKRNLTK